MSPLHVTEMSHAFQPSSFDVTLKPVRGNWHVPRKLWNLEDLKRYFRHFSEGFSSEKISISFKWGLFFLKEKWLISTRDKWPWYFQLLNLRVFIVKWVYSIFLSRRVLRVNFCRLDHFYRKKRMDLVKKIIYKRGCSELNKSSTFKVIFLVWYFIAGRW